MSAWVPFNMDGVPGPIRALPWIGWRAGVDSDGKVKKRPCQIGFPAELVSPSAADEAQRAEIGTDQRGPGNAIPEVKHWRTEGDVREVQIMAPELFTGFGVVLIRAARIAFIDLD